MRDALIAVALITGQAWSFAEPNRTSVQTDWPGGLKAVSGN